MSKVLTQNDIPEIVNSAVAMEETSKVITATMGSIVKLVEKVDIKKIDEGDKKMQIMSDMMKSYCVIVGSIVNTLNEASSNEKDLATIVGTMVETEKQKDGSFKDVKKWTNLDALLQISTIMEKLVTSLTSNDRIEKLNIFGKIKLKRDVEFTIDLAVFAINEMKEQLLKIGDMGMINELMEVLVDGPDTVEEMSIKQDDNKELTDEEKKNIFDRTEKISKKGKVGLITAMKNVFDLFKMMLEMEPPGLIGMMLFKVKIQNFGKMLTITIDEFTKTLGGINSEQVIKQTVDACTIIKGTGKDGNDGILGIVTNMLKIAEMLKSFPNLAVINQKLGMVNSLFNSMIEKLISIFYDTKTSKPSQVVEMLTKPEFAETIKKVKESIGSISDIIKNVSDITSGIVKASLMAILAIPASLIVVAFLYAFKLFIKVLIKVAESLDAEKIKTLDESFKNIAGIFKSLIKIEWGIIGAALLGIVAIPACLVVGLFLFALIGFVWILDKMMDIVAKMINRDMKKDIRELAMTILTLIVIAAAIIILGSRWRNGIFLMAQLMGAGTMPVKDKTPLF